ncbi:MAG: hypothetical protein AB7P00_40270, partial [Sandaracinaceae bacterium]
SGVPRCELGLVEGEACTFLDCVEGLACIRGVCAPRPGEGAPCDPGVECADGLYCVETTQPFSPGVCRADPTGDICSRFPYDDPCPEGWACRLDPSLAGELIYDGRCDAAPPVEIGGACFASVQCGFRGRCVEGRCAHVVLPSEPCGGDEVCPGSHTCDGGVCVARPTLDEPCDATHACWKGRCIDGRCAYAPSGAECSDSGDCDGFCEFPALPREEPPRCRALGQVGDACDYDAQCSDATYCSEPDRVCAPNLCV